MEKRRASHCALPGTDTSTWTGSNLVQIRMGAPPDYSREGQPDDDMTGFWAKPNEDMVQAGCPGAWYRTPWAESIGRYYRRPVSLEDRSRIPNPTLDQCEDWLIHEAVQTLEVYEDAAAYDLRAAYQLAAERKAKDNG